VVHARTHYTLKSGHTPAALRYLLPLRAYLACGGPQRADGVTLWRQCARAPLTLCDRVTSLLQSEEPIVSCRWRHERSQWYVCRAFSYHTRRKRWGGHTRFNGTGSLALAQVGLSPPGLGALDPAVVFVVHVSHTQGDRRLRPGKEGARVHPGRKEL
jgi:hypothetical protein